MDVDIQNIFRPAADVKRKSATVLFGGRLREQNGVAVLLRTLALVREQVPELKAVIVGYGPDQEALEKSAGKLAIADAVTFVGAAGQQALSDFYRRVSCLALPSIIAGSGDREGLPLVPIEAIGCGCPVVSDIPDAREVIDDAGIGWLFKAGGSHGLAERLIYVLHNPDAASEVGRLVRHAIMAKHDWTPISRAYRELCLAALDNNTHDRLECA